MLSPWLSWVRSGRDTRLAALRSAGLVMGLVLVFGQLCTAPPPARLAARLAATAEGVPGADAVDERDQYLRTALVGLWRQVVPAIAADRVRFYYFHGDGQGLYRYGRTGLTQTHAFDWKVEGGRLRLSFRKTDEHADIEVQLLDGGARLVLDGDPREAAGTEYRRDPTRSVSRAADDQPGATPGGRLWIDVRPFAAGGSGFALYQLRAAGIDGRGTGWFHRGDHDEWTTEALTYHVQGDQLQLDFVEVQERHTSGFVIAPDRGNGPAVLHLVDDPRDFWHRHAYLDAGPAFGRAPERDPATRVGPGVAGLVERVTRWPAD